MADYYQELGVSKSASQDEIRKAYRKIARENHPDVKPDDAAAAEKFKRATEAYDVLSDADTRKKYDQFGDAYKYAGKGGGPFPGGGGFRGSGPIDLGDLFGGGQIDLGDLLGGAFGGGRAKSKPRATRGQDIRIDVDIPFHLAATGGTYDVHLQRNGASERLGVKVPAGVNTGSVIRLAGEGQAGANGGAQGDLLIKVRVAPHPFFRREGSNVLLDLPITVSEAALGAQIDVPTLVEGNVTLRVPPGTASGTKLRLREKGVVDPKTKKVGDQLVVIKIVPPRELTSRATELLEELARVAPVNPRTGLW